MRRSSSSESATPSRRPSATASTRTGGSQRAWTARVRGTRTHSGARDAGRGGGCGALSCASSCSTALRPLACMQQHPAEHDRVLQREGLGAVQRDLVGARVGGVDRDDRVRGRVVDHRRQRAVAPSRSRRTPSARTSLRAARRAAARSPACARPRRRAAPTGSPNAPSARPTTSAAATCSGPSAISATIPGSICGNVPTISATVS